MVDQSPFYLVVGLGNPGRSYEETRHNVGFRVLERFADQHQWVFRKVSSLYGVLAEGVVGNKKVLLLKPQTYMNSSGEAVRECVSYYKIPLNQVLVVCDDIYLSLGSLRMKTSGGSGGHNGLKSIESHLGTQVYTRLRVGISDRESGDLADYVLAPFRDEEKQKLPGLWQHAADVLKLWLLQGVVAATQLANTCQEEKNPEKKRGE